MAAPPSSKIAVVKVTVLIPKKFLTLKLHIFSIEKISRRVRQIDIIILKNEQKILEQKHFTYFWSYDKFDISKKVLFFV